MRPARFPSTRTAAVALAAALVAGDALVRGGVDRPALWASALAAAALLALAPGRREPRALLSPLAIGLAGATACIALQLLPLPPGLLRVLSPRAAATLEEALSPAGLFPAWRPLSLDPGATARALAIAASCTAAATAAALLGRSDRRRDALLRVVALSGVVVAAASYGAALLGWSPLLAPTVSFVNPNHLAGFLLLSSFPALGFALRARGPGRVAWLLAFAFAASGVFLSLSRAGIAAFFVGVGAFAVLRIRAGSPADPRPGEPTEQGIAGPARQPPRRGARTVAATGLCGAIAIATFLALDPILAELRTVGDPDANELKLALVPDALRVWRDFPLAGIGRGAFATVYPAYKWLPVQSTFTHVENEWLQLPVELGIAGVGVVALFAWAFVAAARRRDLSRPLAGALAGAAALAAQNLFDFSLELLGVGIPFAIVLGLASRAQRGGVEVPRWAVRTGAAALLAAAAVGLLLDGAHASDADAVVTAGTADEAILRAGAALRWHPADYVAPAAVGQKLAAAGRCGEALPWLSRAMLRNPTAPEPHHAAAACLARAGQHEGAAREYRLAFLYGDRSALAEASRRYPAPGALLAIAPDTPDGLLAAGDLLRARPAESVEAFRRAWESFGDRRALSELAHARLALGEHEDALRLARLLQRLSPDGPEGYLVAARALDALGRAEEARRELEVGAARAPGSEPILVHVGARQLSERRFSQARATFEAIAARDPATTARKRLWIARALEGQGRYLEAVQQASAARDAAPEDPDALATFARLAAAVGRYDDAIDALELAARKPGLGPDAYAQQLETLRSARDQKRLKSLSERTAP